MTWLARTAGYYRLMVRNSKMLGGDGACHVLPRTRTCAECRYFWTDAHSSSAGRQTTDLEWRDLVWEAAEQGNVYPCCACCRDDDLAVCGDDHDWPCPRCRQAPLPNERATTDATWPRP